ncbi:response regulator [Raineyella sp. LH-20]|uniref:response regulator n=1 Tax=Raineyella sp. LH-20 TaxID=3081204 RepID=UPI002952B794|nr:response regulator [Raineyella sp. LH-20]WOP18559.1 response regulator [Raineyella sp. LH-20]
MRDRQVLIVEDDRLTATTYAEYLTRAGAFVVVHSSRTAHDALGFLAGRLRRTGTFGVDMVLLDMNLPDGHGLDVLGQLRAAGFTGGVLAMTADTELETIRRSIALGVVQYLVKPFGYQQFAQRVRSFRDLSVEIEGPGRADGQAEVDRAFAMVRSTGPGDLPKGLTEGTLNTVVAVLQAADRALSAGEVGTAVGSSRVTARRYLEHLHRTGMVDRTPRYGTPGRPENEYRWHPARPGRPTD